MQKLYWGSESENGVEEQSFETAADSTIWQEIDSGATPGRTAIHNIFHSFNNFCQKKCYEKKMLGCIFVDY